MDFERKTKWAIGIVAGVIVLIIFLISFYGRQGQESLRINDLDIIKMVQDTAQSQRNHFDSQAVSLQDSLKSIKCLLTDTTVTFSKADIVKLKKTFDNYIKSDRAKYTSFESRLAQVEKENKVFRKYIQDGFSTKYSRDTAATNKKATPVVVANIPKVVESDKPITTTEPRPTPVVSKKDTSKVASNEKKGVFRFGNKTARPKIKKKPAETDSN